MTQNLKKLLILGTLLIIAVMPAFTLAQDSTGTTGTPDSTGTTGVNMSIKIDNPFKTNTVEGLIRVIVNDILIPVGGVVAVLMIMWAGFLFVTARGDAAQIKRAKDALLWAVIGAAILLGAWVISEAISTTINQLKK